MLKDRIKIVTATTKLVFSNWRYAILSVVLAAIIFVSFIVISNYPLFLTAAKFSDISVFPKVFSNIINTIVSVSGIQQLIGMIAVTFLAGLNVTMFIFKYKFAKCESASKSNLATIGGLFSGAVAAGCPACSISILSLLGVAGGLAILPFRGLEFIFLSIVVLFYSLYLTSKSIYFCKACRIYFKR